MPLTDSKVRRGLLFAAAFWLSAAAALVPSPLLEFRYFIVPTALIVLLTPSAPQRLWVVVFASGIVNALTVLVFLKKSFVWGDGSVARFMW